MSLLVCPNIIRSNDLQSDIWKYTVFYNFNRVLFTEIKLKKINKVDTRDFSKNQVLPICAALLKIIENEKYLNYKYNYSISKNNIWVTTSDPSIMKLINEHANVDNYPLFEKYFDKHFDRYIKTIRAIFVRQHDIINYAPSIECHLSESEIFKKEIQKLYSY